jgi:LysM repeat protein
VGQIKGALTQKIGPFPGWAWAGLTAVGLFVLWPHLKGMFGSGTAAPATTDNTYGDTSGYQPYPQPRPGASPPAPAPVNPPLPVPAPAVNPQPPPPPPPTPPRYKTHTVVSGDTLWGIAQKYLGAGSRWPEIWALSHFRSGNPNLIFPGEIAVLPIAVGGAGMGGARIGSRSADPMAYFHPDLNRVPRYPQLVKAAGGPANHRAELERVAAAMGIHPARLIALNPHYRGLIRVA